MKHIVVSVWDQAAEAYSNPVFVQSKGVALRSFMDAVMDQKSVFSSHPEHYSLFKLGEFDTSTAKFDLLKTPELVANAWELSAPQ